MATGAKPKVLFICHNHPAIRPGGAEGYALDLYNALESAGEFEPVFLARADSEADLGLSPHEGTPISAVNGDPNQYFIYTGLSDWDWLFCRYPDKTHLTRHYRDFLLAHRPDIVHFQHTMFLGYDMIRVTRNTLPDVPIVYTLHEYMSICYRGGQMVRTNGNDLCRRESARRCHECYPQHSTQTFFMRKRFIQSHLSLVDLFLTPSRYALEQYVEWGIPRHKIRVTDHGFKPPVNVPADDPREKRPRNRFGYFGQFTPTKGADVLLEAMSRLGDDFDGHLWVHGANLENQPDDFREQLTELIEAAGNKITLVGSYDHSDLAKLMSRIDWVVIPSIWWETGPLVVGEAFLHGRPVICSDIGGMSERVENGVNGLHFTRKDPDSLADTMRRAATKRDLWDKLRGGIPQVQMMDDHAEMISGMYRELLESDPGAPPMMAGAGRGERG
jgi:glycosyltransferase involved in cell wall biosynthesis